MLFLGLIPTRVFTSSLSSSPRVWVVNWFATIGFCLRHSEHCGSLRTLDVPIFVQRHLPATKTGRMSPLMRTSRTTPSGLKRVPGMPASGKEKFWRTDIGANPTVKRTWFPDANWAANLGKICWGILEYFNDFEVKRCGIRFL